MYSMRHYGARFMLGEKVERIETHPDRAVVHLSSGTAGVGEGEVTGRDMHVCMCVHLI